MPELPEVETVVKALRKALIGRVLVGAKSLGKVRIPFNARAASPKLAGRAFRDVKRRAKYIVMVLDDGQALLAHLGMTGFFHIEPAQADRLKHDRLVFPLGDGEELRYADARRFGFVKLVSLGDSGWPEELDGLGYEPLERGFGGPRLAEKAAGRKCPVKNFIMDQEVVVGVGNIYASEALFAAGIDPRRPAGMVSGEEWNRLAGEIRSVLRKAIRQGGSTIRNYRTVDGSEGSFQRRLLVYGRAGEECPACGETLQSIRLGGRSSFYCPRCQN